MSLESRLKISKIKYSDIQEILNKKYDAVRKAVKRESFSDLELKEIAYHFEISFVWLKNGTGEIKTQPISENESSDVALLDEQSVLTLIKSLRTKDNAEEIDLLIDETKSLLRYKEAYLRIKSEVRKRLKV